MRGVVFGVLLFFGLVWAAPAGADDDAYLAELHNQPGFVNRPMADQGYLSSGHQVCESLGSGVSPDDVVAQMQGLYTTRYMARIMVLAAQRWLCVP